MAGTIYYLVTENADGSLVLHNHSTDVQKLRDLVAVVIRRHAQDQGRRPLFLAIADGPSLEARHGTVVFGRALQLYRRDTTPTDLHPRLLPGVK